MKRKVELSGFFSELWHMLYYLKWSEHMFSVLCISESKRRKPPRRCTVEALLSPVKGAAPYKIINVTPGRKGIDWKAVCVAAGCANCSMLLPESVEVPLYVPVIRFEPQVLPLLAALNTAIERSNKATAYKRSLLVCDSKAVLADYLMRAVPYASKITVATACPELYLKTAVEIMDEYGATIKLCSEADPSVRYDVAVSDGEKANAELCITSADIKNNADKLFWPDEYTRMCPPQIDAFDFMCALFECGGVTKLTDVKL